MTKLDRDPASGTALQEISFWLNLERALYRIQEKRESPEVLLTLDILKHGKRFHATVSFDTDTGKGHPRPPGSSPGVWEASLVISVEMNTRPSFLPVSSRILSRLSPSSG